MKDTYIKFDEATKTISADALPLDVKDSWEYGVGFFGWTAERISEPTLTDYYNLHKTLIKEFSEVTYS